ncbi:MAG TPA: hypothetical protein VD884_17635 [Ohtaekwangia sp.]|nr:hypothetical protein [Ohtaekwangia sp.]
MNWNKRAVTAALMVIVITIPSHAQTFNEWFKQKKTQKTYLIQQIAALKVYLEYLKDGYDIVKKGMTLVGDIKEGNFNSHKEYFGSLKKVNRLVSSSPQASRIVYLQTLTVRLISQLRNRLDDSELTEAEREYLEKVCSNLLTITQDNTEQFETLLTDGKLEMKDDERIDRLNDLYNEVLTCFTFTKTFTNDTGLLILQREKERREVREAINLTEE